MAEELGTSKDTVHTIILKDLGKHVLQTWRQSKNVTAVLRSIPKGAFADSFQKLYERCQKCVVKDGDYFEGQ